MTELIRLRTEIEEKEKEILSKFEIVTLKEYAADLIFLKQVWEVMVKYFPKDKGLESITVNELLEYFHEKDLEFFNIFDEDTIVDFLSNILLINNEIK